jgi:hypothetical protein
MGLNSSTALGLVIAAIIYLCVYVSYDLGYSLGYLRAVTYDTDHWCEYNESQLEQRGIYLWDPNTGGKRDDVR